MNERETEAFFPILLSCTVQSDVMVTERMLKERREKYRVKFIRVYTELKVRVQCDINVNFDL